MALDLKTECERCRMPLAPEGRAAICAFECTFCSVCSAEMMHVCPNCGGELAPRPRRKA